ncbi:PucR family transcriptional regulator [Streptomyces graminilatus]|uniref:PucR family transcriptional regulator n=1 Tax=Streptomyces graminilatus TaxID=1464070 RepID=UPI0006E25CB7|nr:helix-turn-helix domain-containing protein [Streptomyces graminilatus]
MDLTSVGAALHARLPELGERMAKRIRAEAQSYQDESLIPFDSLREYCRRNVDLLLRHFAFGTPLDVQPARETGRLRAEQGVPLSETLHAYRIGFEYLWAEMVKEARGHPEVTDAHLVAGASELWAMYGCCTEALATAYREASAEVAAQREARRSALVEALLTGAIADGTTLWEAARQLGLPERGPYVVAVAHVPDPGDEPLPGIEAALREARVQSAWRLLPHQQVGLISLTSAEADAVTFRALGARKARVGVSPCFDSLRDTPQALRFAGLALAGLPTAESGVARFDDSPLAMLVAAAPAEAARLARLVMGPILDLPAPERGRLMETLKHWFDAGGDATGAASGLYVHPNTVRYRLHKIEKLTGRSLSDPAALADLGTALHACRIQHP